MSEAPVSEGSVSQPALSSVTGATAPSRPTTTAEAAVHEAPEAVSVTHDGVAPDPEYQELPRPDLTATGAIRVARLRGWRRRYRTYLLATDTATVLLSVIAAQMITAGGIATSSLAQWTTAGVIALCWLAGLAVRDVRNIRILGTGSEEFKRITETSLGVIAAVALVAYLAQLEVSRALLLVALPLGLGGLLVTRTLWRMWLKRQRRGGEYSSRVILVGSRSSVENVASELLASPAAGYRIVGACVPTGNVGETLAAGEIPVMGSIASIPAAMRATIADTVVVTSTDDLPADKVKQISWGLEAGRQHLVLAPSIVDIAGPRVHMRHVSGLPLIHVETPRFTRTQRLMKRAFDLFAAGLLIVLISPLVVTLAIIVKATSPGPVLYKQERIGLDGEPFKMLKFRSMRVGADGELAMLLQAQGTSTEPLFKIKNDPRITPIGRIIRKYSLDELPQLFNVLGGSMSLVGPRPQIAAEVALYSDKARRRLLARPGITGLWQVSGRSGLDWDQTVRLDLYYVENWSLLGDIAILIRTVKAVAMPGESAH